MSGTPFFADRMRHVKRQVDRRSNTNHYKHEAPASGLSFMPEPARLRLETGWRQAGSLSYETAHVARVGKTYMSAIASRRSRTWMESPTSLNKRSVALFAFWL